MDNGGGAGARSGLGFWDIWDPGRWSSAAAASSCSNFPDNAVVPTGGGDHHHLTCLKLGKRQYYGGDGAAASATGSKRERPPQPTAMSGPPPRCQVADCDKVLWDAKEYHRRHKVCEAHSKAPRVVVLGSVQRFCQQCSRFHAISEFDDSKRSCRRRLAGHNERRRKSSGGGAAAVTNSEYIIMNPPVPPYPESTSEVSRFAYESSRSRALSLLSSKAAPWISTPDLPSRSSAALRELIAENRAATLAHHLISEHGCWRDNIAPMQQHKREPQSHRAPTSQLANIWSLQLQDPGNNLNADIMQTPPGSSLDIFSRIGLL